MKSKTFKKWAMILGGIASMVTARLVFAASGVEAGIAGVAQTATSNLLSVAQLVTAGSYLGGMGIGVVAIVKFKAHKENSTQVPISQPIALLFISAALLFIPSVFSSAGHTLFVSGQQAGIGGVYSF